MQKNNTSTTSTNAQSKRNSFARRILILSLLVLILVLVSLSITGQASRLWYWIPTFFPVKASQQPAAYQLSPSTQSKNQNPDITVISSVTPSSTNTPIPLVVYTSTASTPTQILQTKLNESDMIQGTLILSIAEGGYTHLFAYQPQKLPFTRLTSGPWQDITPAVSPDGTLLAFSSNRSGNWDLYTLDLSSGETKRLTDTPEYDGSPSWSPDGRWLVYESYLETSQDKANLELFIRQVSADAPEGQVPLQLTNDPGADLSPTWSPSGRQIAFISTRDGNNDVWLADLDEVDNRFINLSYHLLSPNSNPVWSPDGSRLLWSSNREGIKTLYTWEPGKPEIEPQPIGNGGWAIWSPDGSALITSVQSPNQTYLTGFYLQDSRLLLPPIALNGPLAGLAWTTYTLPSPLPSSLEQAAQLTPAPLWQTVISEPPDEQTGRQNVVPLDNVIVPFPYLHDLLNESFQALRQEVIRQVGWDFLGRLENAYVPLTTPLFPGMLDDWLYTGRAFSTSTAPADTGWLVAVREDHNGFTFWHVYLRTRLQDGTQGIPLHELPWDFGTRNLGNVRNYDQGGSLMEKPPPGYWIDFTQLASSYGWERLPALSSWRNAIPAARYNEFVNRSNSDWYSAMLEIYPPEALVTVTPPPPPSATPTKTPIPSRTPIPTQTFKPSQTPTQTRTSTIP
jgi:TolB protein